MPYNPRRLEGNPRRVRRQDPHAGRKHSDVVGRGGPRATSLVDMSRKENTADGWVIPIFSGPDFDVFYRYICAKNNSGQLKHETKDQVVRVLAGRLYVMVNGGSAQELVSTQSIALGRGVAYEVATSGTEDAELIVCQGHDYSKDVEHITMPGSVTAIQKAASPVFAPQIVRRSESQAYHQAEIIGAAKESARKTARTPYHGRAPLAGQQVVGLNPRPIGAGGFGED